MIRILLLLLAIPLLLVAAVIIQSVIEEAYLRRRCEMLEAALDALKEARDRER